MNGKLESHCKSFQVNICIIDSIHSFFIDNFLKIILIYIILGYGLGVTGSSNTTQCIYVING